jgi:MerR family copper efflux transcriptional regulator
MHRLSIGQLAKSADVSIDTIRFYEKAGLLRAGLRRPSGFREYSELDFKQLRFIRRGRLLGLSLEEIGELLALESTQASATGVVQQKLAVIDRRIEELQRWRSTLVEFMAARSGAGHANHSLLDCFVEEGANARQDTVEPRTQDAELRDCHDEN